MSDPKQTTEGTAKVLEEMLSPRVEIGGIAGDAEIGKINAVLDLPSPGP